MRLYAHLFLAILVLRARAATIPDRIVWELEKKLPRIILDETKLPTDNVSSEQRRIDPAITSKDVENHPYTVEVVKDIPVKVNVDGVEPAVRTISEEKDFAYKFPEEAIIPPLENTGLSQRQDIEKQNPEHYKQDELSSSSAKQRIQETQLILQQDFQGVTDDIQNWYGNNDQVIKIQSIIENLKKNFTTSVEKLNETLERIAKSKLVKTKENESKIRASLQNLETRLNILQDNFNSGVKTLTEGNHNVASLRAESEGGGGGNDTSGPSTSTPNPNIMSPFVILVSLFSNLQSSVTSDMANVAQNMNNMMNNSTGWNLSFVPVLGTGATLVDTQVETGTTSSRPSSGQNIQNSSSSNPGQQNQTLQPTQQNQTSQPIQSTQQNQTAQPTQQIPTTQQNQTAQPSQQNQTTQSTKPSQQNQTTQSNQQDQTWQPARPAQSNWFAQPAQASWLPQPAQPTWLGQPAQSTWLAQPAQPTWPGQPIFSNPFNAIQNIPNQIIQNFQNFIKKPNQSATKLAEASSSDPASNQGGHNEGHTLSTEMTESKRESEKKAEAAKQPEFDKIPETAKACIRPDLENIPVQDALTGAVGKQTANKNPEPKDTSEKNKTEKETDGLIVLEGHNTGSGSFGHNDVRSGLESGLKEHESITEQKTQYVEEIPTVVQATSI